MKPPQTAAQNRAETAVRVMTMRSSDPKYKRDARRPLGLQIAASLGAAVCVAALFGGGAPTPPSAVVAGDTGKSVRRIADAQSDATVLRIDPQQQALMASLASFTPKASEPSPVLVATPRAKVANVLPPPRPAFDPMPTGSLPPPASLPVSVPPRTQEQANTTAPSGWRVAGVEIPGSAQVRRYVPSSAAIARTGDAAWTASANVVKKVAGLGSLFGL